MNDALKNLLTRRSCRAYKPEQIKPEELNAVLEAGTYAPTGMGQQSPLIVAIQDPETLAKVEKLNAEIFGNPEAKPFYGAPTAVVVFGDTEVPYTISDANLVLGNILNAAHAVGLDSCYIWRAKEVFETEEGKALMKEWGIPENYVGAANVILGYCLEEGRNVAPPRKPDYIKIV